MSDLQIRRTESRSAPIVRTGIVEKSKQIVLVTGATGYIGSQVLHALWNTYGDRVILRAFVRKNSDIAVLSGLPIDILRGDIGDPSSLFESFDSVDTVFHSAGLVAYTRNYRHRLYETNVTGTANVVNSCLQNGVRRLVLTSSVAAAGVNDGSEPADEETEFKDWQRNIAYMESKRLAEMEGMRGIAEGLDVVFVNPGVVIGRGRSKHAITNSATKAIQDIGHGKIPLYPSGGLSLVDISDVAKAHLEVWEKGKTGERYIIVSENRSYKELFSLLWETNKKSSAFALPARKPLYEIAGSAGELYAFFSGARPYISFEGMRLSRRHLYFSNRKSVEELGMRYRPVRDSVRSIIE